MELQLTLAIPVGGDLSVVAAVKDRGEVGVDDAAGAETLGVGVVREDGVGVDGTGGVELRNADLP